MSIGIVKGQWREIQHERHKCTQLLQRTSAKFGLCAREESFLCERRHIRGDEADVGVVPVFEVAILATGEAEVGPEIEEEGNGIGLGAGKEGVCADVSSCWGLEGLRLWVWKGDMDLGDGEESEDLDAGGGGGIVNEPGLSDVDLEGVGLPVVTGDAST
ncbi:hypothetical protein CPC08DRAFT_724298 [Agrocybe pediades]|nr:hypothetical protein CPC08DRAFT_724298 [Agrocybe pediades]